MEPQKWKTKEEIESIESKKLYQEDEFTKSHISAESNLNLEGYTHKKQSDKKSLD